MDKRTDQKVDTVSERSLPMKANWDLQVTEEDFGRRETEVEEERVQGDISEHDKYSWKEIALFLDRVTMYNYLIVVTSVTVALVIIFACHYTSTY